MQLRGINIIDKRYLIGAVIVVVAATVATSSAILLFFGRVAAKLHCIKGTECRLIAKDLEPVDAGEPQTVMVLGSDVRYQERKLGYPERSDTLMLVRLDPDRGQISLLSFPRDLKVNIPGHGDDKLNAAYAIGGVRLSLKVIKQLTGLKVNHVVNVNFRGFKDVVNEIGCVYFDVDHHYYHSNVGLAPSEQYAEINVYPGYQKLCGPKALDFVRYRHDENGDITRQARQQSFLREARRQLSPSKLIDDRDKLINLFARHTTSDIQSSEQLQRMLKLVVALAGKPIHSVKLKTRITASYVYASPDNIQRAVREFMGYRKATGGKGKKGGSKRKGKRGGKTSYQSLGLENGVDSGVEQAAFATPKAGFPVLFPRLRLAGSQYDGPARVYRLRGTDHRVYRAVKMVLKTGAGYYYGIMETNWKSPPILGDPSESREVSGRKLLLYYDRSKLRTVAFKTPQAAYWVSNTLENELTGQQLVRIASSMTKKP